MRDEPMRRFTRNGKPRPSKTIDQGTFLGDMAEQAELSVLRLVFIIGSHHSARACGVAASVVGRCV